MQSYNFFNFSLVEQRISLIISEFALFKFFTNGKI